MVVEGESEGGYADGAAAELLRRWREEDDVDALDALLRSEVEGVARHLRARGGGLLRPSQSAGDLAQEAVLRWLDLDAAPEFTSPAALRAYLWTAAWRLLLNRARRPGRALVELDARASGSLSGAFARSGGITAHDDADQRLALTVAINLLREDDRTILGLVYIEGVPIDEAAARLAITRANADMRLTRARRRLAERLVGWAEVIG